MPQIFENPLSKLITMMGNVLVQGTLRVNKDVQVKDGDKFVSLVEYIKDHSGMTFKVEKFDETYTTQAALITKVTDFLNGGTATEQDKSALYFIERDATKASEGDVFDEYVFQVDDQEAGTGHMERIGSTKASEIFMEDVPVDATFGHDLTVKGNTSLQQSVLISGPVDIENNLNVKGKTHFKQSVSFSGPVYIEDNLNVKNNTSLQQSVLIGGPLYIEDNLSVIRNIRVDGKATFENTSIFKGPVSFAKNLYLQKENGNTDWMKLGVERLDISSPDTNTSNVRFFSSVSFDGPLKFYSDAELFDDRKIKLSYLTLNPKANEGYVTFNTSVCFYGPVCLGDTFRLYNGNNVSLRLSGDTADIGRYFRVQGGRVSFKDSVTFSGPILINSATKCIVEKDDAYINVKNCEVTIEDTAKVISFGSHQFNGPVGFQYNGNNIAIFGDQSVISFGPIGFSFENADRESYPYISDYSTATSNTVTVNAAPRGYEYQYSDQITYNYTNNDDRSIFVRQVNNLTDNIDFVDDEAIMYDVDEVYGEPIINGTNETVYKNAKVYDLGEVTSSYTVPPLNAYQDRVTQCEVWFKITSSSADIDWTANYSDGLWIDEIGGTAPDFALNKNYRVVIRREGLNKTILNVAYNY